MHDSWNAEHPGLCNTTAFLACQVLGARSSDLIGLRKVPTPWRREVPLSPSDPKWSPVAHFSPLCINACQPGKRALIPNKSPNCIWSVSRCKQKRTLLPRCQGAPPQGNRSTGAAGPSSRWRATQPQASAWSQQMQTGPAPEEGSLLEVKR